MAVHRDLTPRLLAAAQTSPSITLTGPRQSGKTTLSRSAFPRHSYVSLEAPDVRAFAADDPRAFLARYPDGAIIDEVQRVPELPSYLQGIIDDAPEPGRWVLTGSQRPRAGRVGKPVPGRSHRDSPPPSPCPERGRPVRPAPEHAGGGTPRRRLPSHIRRSPRPLRVAAFIRRHLHRTRCEDHQPGRRPHDLPALRGAVRRAHGAAHQLLGPGERLRRISANRESLAQHTRSQLHPLSASSLPQRTWASGW